MKKQNDWKVSSFIRNFIDAIHLKRGSGERGRIIHVQGPSRSISEDKDELRVICDVHKCGGSVNTDKPLSIKTFQSKIRKSIERDKAIRIARNMVEALPDEVVIYQIRRWLYQES